MLTIFLLALAACVALFVLPIAFVLMLRALPLFLGLCLCWWMFHLVGCL